MLYRTIYAQNNKITVLNKFSKKKKNNWKLITNHNNSCLNKYEFNVVDL